MQGTCYHQRLLRTTAALLLLSACLALQFDDFDRRPDSVTIDYGPDHPMLRSRQRQRRLQETTTDDSLSSWLLYPSNTTNIQEPLRIHFVTELLEQRRGESLTMDAQITAILETALPQAAALWSRHLSVVPVASDISVTTNMCFGAFGAALQPVTVSNADLVVIVSGQDFLLNPNGISASPVCLERSLAVASSCVLDQWDRPVVGFLNLCLDNQVTVKDTDVFLQSAFSQKTGTTLRPTHVQTSTVDVLVHELGHILAFAAYLYKFYRHADGTPRTPRPFVESTVQCVDGRTVTGQAPSNTTVRLVQDTTGGSASSSSSSGTQKWSYSIVTPTVQQVARNQLNCQDNDMVVGARLEDQAACFGSHWHERLFMGEIMSAALSVSSENILSPLTLALMKDTGWYTVDFTDAGIPSFGLGAGCEFVTNDCIVNDQVPAWGKGYFCDSPIRFTNGALQAESMNNIVCDPGHRAWTLCDLWDQRTVPRDLISIPDSSRRYFSDNDLVPLFSLAEYCPIPTQSLGLDCTKEDEYVPHYKGESVGSESRCLNGFKRGGQTVNRPACMKVTCDIQQGRVIIGNQGNERICAFDGQILSLDGGASNEYLECPRLATVCPELFACPKSCAGEGVCDYDGVIPVCVDTASAALNPKDDEPTTIFVSDPNSSETLSGQEKESSRASGGTITMLFQLLMGLASAVLLLPFL